MVYVEEEADDSPLHCPTPIVAFLTVKRNRKDKGRDAYAFLFFFFLIIKRKKHHKREVGVIHDFLIYLVYQCYLYTCDLFNTVITITLPEVLAPKPKVRR